MAGLPGSPVRRAFVGLLLFAALGAAAPSLLAQGGRAVRQPTDDLTRGVPSRVLDSGLLRAAYMDLYGRPPYGAERRQWLGGELADLSVHLIGSREFWNHWLDEQLYFFLLIDNFRPESERVRKIPPQMAARRLGVRDALHRIALSPSFDRRNPGADTFVTVVMEQLLGMTVQRSVRELEIGKRLYDGRKGNFLGRAGDSQADVVRIAIEDDRCLQEYLGREHARMLRRGVRPREVKRWAKGIEEDSLSYAEVVRGWLLSDAYLERVGEHVAQPNRLFVRALFVDLVDRLPDKNEEQQMRNALDGLSDPGPLRSVLARLLIDSGTAELPSKKEIEDPTLWVAGLFEQLLGRPASEDELREFVTAFHDPACKPSTVVYAIVSHPEYHTY